MTRMEVYRCILAGATFALAVLSLTHKERTAAAIFLCFAIWLLVTMPVRP